MADSTQTQADPTAASPKIQQYTKDAGGYPETRWIPARYVGHSSVLVPPRERGRKYLNAEGRELATKMVPVKVNDDGSVVLGRHYALYTGDTAMMPDYELLGQTLLIDPTHQQHPLWLGWGWCPLARHQDYNPVELRDMRFRGPDGVIRHYEFHAGRSDFEPLHPEQEPTYFQMPSKQQIDAEAREYAARLREAEKAEREYEYAQSPEGQAALAEAEAVTKAQEAQQQAASAPAKKPSAVVASTAPAATVAEPSAEQE